VLSMPESKEDLIKGVGHAQAGHDVVMSSLAAREAALEKGYVEYLRLVGNDTFVDVARKTDAACNDQPWRTLSRLAERHGAPRILQLWTKGPRAALARGGELLARLRRRGAAILCQLTVTGYGPTIEPLVPWPVDWEGIDRLIEFLGTPEAVLWRFDPVIPGVADLGTLRTLAAGFASRGVVRAVYNWIEVGWEVVRRRLGPLERQLDTSLDRNVFSRLIEAVGQDCGVAFSILAEGDGLAGDLTLSTRGAWQYEWLLRVGPGFPSRGFLPAAFRPGCMCAPSFDVGLEGQFDGCHRCLYCFAP